MSKDSTANRTNYFNYENIEFVDLAKQNFSHGHPNQTLTVS